MSETLAAHNEQFISPDGDMAELIRSKDWSKTPLGPIESWPPTLRTMVSLLLSNRFPMLLWWGPDYIQIYNDAYRPVLGSKHPSSLGQPTHECWAEIWHIIGPLIDTPFSGGPATWMEDLQLEINRHGFFEETHFTVAYSPVPDGSAPGAIGGVLATVHEITEKVVGERRISVLRDLGTRAVEAKSAQAACAMIAETLARHPKDIPFALLYLIDPDRRHARLAGAAHIAVGTRASPVSVDLTEPSETRGVWPLAEALATEILRIVDGLESRFGAALPAGPWSDRPVRAVVVPIRSNIAHQLAGFLVAGISSRLRFDRSYQSFVELAASQIANAIAGARAYEEERKRAEALAELDRAKTAFFSNVSHEFRTPLTLMLGPVEELLSQNQAEVSSRAKSQLELVNRNAHRLLRLVNTLLDFSRIEAGRTQASYEPTDLAAITADLASVFRAATERAGLELVIDCRTLSAPVFVDRDMWEKIVLNLISNAFKFTFDGAIEVSLRERKDADERAFAELLIRDTGVGIPAEEMPRLFERFHRIESTRSRTHEGSGIGLALVHELVKLHGGSVRAESAPGQGTTFTVTLPIGSGHLPPERIGAERAAGSASTGAAPFLEEALRWLPESSSEAGSKFKVEGSTLSEPFGELEPATTPQTKIGNPKPRIIVADDNADMRHYLTRLLRERYEVTPVPNGKAALDAARERVPDLVLTDVMMPELDGFGLLQSLRGDVRTATVPVVLLSARAGEESRVEGMEAGADDYLIKPFSARELLARVSARLEISRLRREAAAQQQAAYEAVRASEERLEAFFNSTSVGAAVLLPSARFILVNDAFCRIVGYSRDELISLGCADIMHDDDFSGMKELFDDLIAGGKNAVVAEKRYRSKDGAVIWLQNSVALTRDAAGQPLHLVVLSQDVTDRRRAEEALREADRRKDEFIAMLGHELRNPLGIISNGVQVLKRIAPREPQLDDVEEMIERQVTHTSRLLDDLLDISRIARGKIQLDKKRQSLDEIVRQTLTDHSGAFQERKIRLRADIPQRTLWVMADSTRIAQAFGNLLANAVKFTETNGTVTVKLRTEMDDAVLSVRDTGIGIESAMLGRIFETFIQADRSLERTRGGLGLGLALVKGIVELHGGRVMASSDGPGSGSEFTIRLPLDHSPSIHVPAVPDANVSVRGYRILLIEDNPIAARSTRLLLEQSGHTVEVAHDGVNGVETARRFRPEIVLCDIGLPGMDGYRVAETLRVELGNDGAYLIALSGYAQNDGRAPKAGFNAHLTKPLDFAQLEKMLAALAVKPRDLHGSSEAEARAGRSTV